MPVQPKYRPHHLALAIALGLGCADFSLAQELPSDAVSVVNTPDQLLAQLDAFIKHADTVPVSISKPTEGENRTFGEENNLVIVSGRATINGSIDGGGGDNFLQLDTTIGGTLEDTRHFNGLEVKRNTWTVKSSDDFGSGVVVRPKATLINEGNLAGRALVQGAMLNKGSIAGAVKIDKKGSYAGDGVAGSLEVNGKVYVGGVNGAPRVDGDLNLTKSAELSYEVGADGSSSTMLVEGTASLGKATLNIVAPKDYSLTTGHRILEAGKVEGEFGNVINDLAFLDHTLEYPGTTVDLIFVRNAVTIASLGTSENARELGANIEEPTHVIQSRETPENTLPITELPIPSAENATAIVAPQEPIIEPDQPVLPAEVVTQTAAAEVTEDYPAVAPAVTMSAPIAAESPAGAVAQAAAQPVVVQPVAVQPTVAATAAAPKAAATPKNAAIAALLRSDKLTASRALEQLASGNTANLAKATLNSDAPIGATMLSAMRQLDRSFDKSGARNAPRLAAGSEATGRVWLQTLGHGGTLDRDMDALKHSTKGLVLGADWSVGEAWRLGMIGGKSDTRLDSRGLDGDLDSWHLGAYALRQSGPVSLRLGAAYSQHDATSKRRVAFNGFSDRLKGRYDANSQQAFAELGYKLDVANTSIEPFAGIGYQRYQRDSYTEKGGAAALQIHGQTQDNISSTFGLRLARLNTLDNGLQLIPRFSAGWKHTYGEIDNQTRQRLVTGSRDFTVAGAAQDRNSLLVDAGLDLAVSARHSLGIGLNGEVGTDSRNHGVTGRWRMSF
ncbi:autotransporter outer membrane beta-barrel domain-containing protein [Pseudomonas sp. PB3P13]